MFATGVHSRLAVVKPCTLTLYQMELTNRLVWSYLVFKDQGSLVIIDENTVDSNQFAGFAGFAGLLEFVLVRYVPRVLRWEQGLNAKVRCKSAPNLFWS